MAQEKRASGQAGLSLAAALVWVALIAAAVVLILSGYGEVVIIAAFIAAWVAVIVRVL